MYYLCSDNLKNTLSIMKNNITTAMLEEILSLNDDEKAAVLQFCKDSESMTDEQVTKINVTQQGPAVLKTLQRKAVRRAKNAIRHRERKIREEKSKQEQPNPQPEQPEPRLIRPVGTSPTIFAPGEPVILSKEAMRCLEWADNLFPREVTSILFQKIEQLIFNFGRLLQPDENRLIQAMVYNSYTSLIDKTLSVLLSPA